MNHWHLITGEYPPQPGGVSDYTAQLAGALADNGAEVHVWCPPATGVSPERSGVRVHRLRRHFGRAGIRELADGLAGFEEPRRLLVQYAPNALGLRGLNLPFCYWLTTRAGQDDVRVMFHEPYFYFSWRRPHRNLLAIVQRLMAVLLLKASQVVYLSSQTWERYLTGYMWFGRRPLVWLPVPAAVPRVEDASSVRRLRETLTLGRTDTPIVGHFGTHGGLEKPLLHEVVAGLLGRDPILLVQCVGTNSDRFAQEVVERHPAWRGRVIGRGHLSVREISRHLQACDLMVQPYPDGVTTRRTTVMTALVNAVPVVTTAGPLTEAIWTEGQGVALAPVGDTAALVERAVDLLGHAERRAALGRRGAELYDAHFTLARVVERLNPAREVFATGTARAPTT